MCGRFVQAASPELLAERFSVAAANVDVGKREPDYNVTPRRSVPVVRERDGQRFLSDLRWGLVPSWAKDIKIGDRMINARAETVGEKNAYRRAFAKRRCIIPADGFYEWKRRPGERRKEPWFIHRRDGEPMALAGLWEYWRNPADPDGEPVRSCVIVTTTANGALAPIHDRMPVILPESSWDWWLDPATSIEVVQGILVPAADDVVATYPVSTRVNSPANNDAELVARADAGPG